jgi:hypothetical protein
MDMLTDWDVILKILLRKKQEKGKTTELVSRDLEPLVAFVVIER